MKHQSWSASWLRLCVALCLVIGLVIATPGHAQNSQGTILGHVTDPTGAALAGAKVTIKNVNTNITREAKTSGVGDYVFVNITPGLYDIVVEGAGFKKAQALAVTLNVDATLRQNFALEVGAAAEQVTVEAEAQMVQSDNASSGNVIASKLIEDTPLSGRDFNNLLKLQAGATTMKEGEQVDWAQHGFNKEFQGTSINGARTESISFLIDGVSDNDQFFGTAASTPSSAAIEEFKVQNGLYSAEYGQGSAQVNVAIKSGGNKLHGTAYDYWQNSALQPSNEYNKWKNEDSRRKHEADPTVVPLNLPLKDKYNQHQAGGTLGGPLVIPHLYNGTNKTFWFFNYEIGTNRQSQTSAVVVPSDLERNGDFSDWGYQLYDPATTGQAPVTATNPAGRLPFVNNQIPTGRFDPLAIKLLQYYPKPTTTCTEMSTCSANYNTSLSKPYDTNNATFRVDQNFSEKDRVYFTGIIQDQKFSNPSAMTLSGETKYTASKLYGFNWQHALTTNALNELHLGYTWMKFHNGAETTGSNIQEGLGFNNPPADPSLWGVPIVSMGSYQTLGNGNARWVQKNNNYQLGDNLKITRGRHTLAMGVDIRRVMVEMQNNYGGPGSMNFTGAFTASDPNRDLSDTGFLYHGNGFADFLLGYPMTATGADIANGNNFAVRATNWNFFVQDDFRVSPRLTVNLGVRYEIPPAYHEIGGNGMTIDTTNGGGYIWHDQAFVDQVSAVDGVNPNRIRCCVDDKIYQTNHKNFAPRIGVAWRPFNTDRFVVRSGYGIFYDLYNRWYDLSDTYARNSTYVSMPFYFDQGNAIATSSQFTTSQMWGPNAPNSYDYFKYPDYMLSFSSGWAHNKSPYNQQWTLDTQYAVSESLLLDVAYVGSHALHQPGYWYYNSAPMPTGPYDDCNYYRSAAEAPASCLSDPNFSPVNVRKPYPNLPANGYADANIFNSNYNALQVRLNQRYSHGLQYQLGYTWSRVLDENSAINLADGEMGFLQDQHNLHGDYGPANYDQPKRFVANGTYDLPVGKGKRWSLGPLNSVLGDWQVGGVFVVASGTPFTIYSGLGGRAQNGSRADILRPNLVDDPNAGDQTIYRWFNTDAYQVQEHNNTYGNVGRNTLRGPYFMKTDLSFGKDFRITERHSLEYRLEIFNVGSNWHSAPPTPSSWVTSPSFGRLVPMDGSGDLALHEHTQRTIQMDLKYTF